jgi:sulfite exporter TauE/SafE
MSTAKGYRQGLSYTIAFSLGRILVYVILGMLFALIGKTLNITIPGWVLAAFMVVLALSLFFRVHTKCLVSRIKVTGHWMSFVAGVVMGFSPCAPLLAALALAVASKSMVLGALIALIFGIGTILSPILLIGVVSGKWASMPEFKGVNRYVASGFLIVMAAAFAFQ